MDIELHKFQNNKATTLTFVSYGVILFFSYETQIGLWFNGHKYYRPNEWGPTTGRHMNYFGLNKHECNVHIVTPEKLKKLTKEAIFDMVGTELEHKILK